MLQQAIISSAGFVWLMSQMIVILMVCDNFTLFLNYYKYGKTNQFIVLVFCDRASAKELVWSGDTCVFQEKKKKVKSIKSLYIIIIIYNKCTVRKTTSELSSDFFFFFQNSIEDKFIDSYNLYSSTKSKWLHLFYSVTGLCHNVEEMCVMYNAASVFMDLLIQYGSLSRC